MTRLTDSGRGTREDLVAFLLIRHTVADDAKWKPIYDEHARSRKANGSKAAHLFRSADNPNELVILLEWDDLKNARRFTESDDLRQAMQRAGVADRPDLYFLEDVEKAPA